MQDKLHGLARVTVSEIVEDCEIVTLDHRFYIYVILFGYIAAVNVVPFNTCDLHVQCACFSKRPKQGSWWLVRGKSPLVMRLIAGNIQLYYTRPLENNPSHLSSAETYLILQCSLA